MEQRAKQHFWQAVRQQFEAALSGIAPDVRPTIYALSCWYFIDEDELRFPTLMLSYNTTQQVQAQLSRASSEAEATWNFAFWLQNELATVGGQADEILAAWFRATPFYYSEAEKTTGGDAAAKLLEQGELFNQQFIAATIKLIQQLFADGVVTRTFGRDIPILLHELEYYDQPIAWTILANPPGLADNFLRAYAAGMI